MEVVAVLGPTASGKTDLALVLARELGGEIISADSRQIYRKLDAGTLKPERDAAGLVEGISYHLVDLLDPKEVIDAGNFADLARPLLSEIRSRERLPIVCGGTGLYVRALESGLSILPRRDESLRQSLYARAEKEGPEALHADLKRIDPAAAEKIPPKNLQRLVRALEVCALTKRPISSLWRENPPRQSNDTWIKLVIEWPSDQLRRRIEERARQIWPNILREVAELRNAGYTGSEPGFQSHGYPQAWKCLRGEMSQEEGLASLIQTTCAYAKRQRTWLRHQLTDTITIASGPIEKMAASALEAIKGVRARHLTHPLKDTP